MENLISVIIPAKNASTFLELAIQSVQEQDFPNWELILINDGSTDNTLEIAEKKAAIDKRVKVYSIANSGQGAARNYGLKKAKGDFVAFLDADDVWLPNFLSVQFMAINNTGADVVFADAFVINEKSIVVGKLGAPPMILKGRDGVAALLNSNKVPVLTVVAKKEAILNVGGFTEKSEIRNAEDYHLWIKLVQMGARIVGNGEPLAKYRLHPGASTAKERSVAIPVIYAMLELHEQFGTVEPLFLNTAKIKLKEWLKKYLPVGHGWEDNALRIYSSVCGGRIPVGYKLMRRILPGASITKKWIHFCLS